jgi:hypothetical protein
VSDFTPTLPALTARAFRMAFAATLARLAEAMT